jgi:hypothetical protein
MISTTQPVVRLKTLFGIFGICGLVVLAGCQLPPVDKASSGDLLNLSRPLEAQEFRLTAARGMRPVQIVVANSSDVTGGYGAGGNYAEIARTDLNEIFSNCENYIVANRSVNRQASAELKLRESTSPQQSATAPATPQFIIKATVMQVERETKSDGTKTAWQYLITAESAKAQRQGAVEVLVEVVGLDKLTTVFATRSYALLYDQTKESSLGLPVMSAAKKSTKRVPERQAIRTACQDGAAKVHTYFKSQH